MYNYIIIYITIINSGKLIYRNISVNEKLFFFNGRRRSKSGVLAEWLRE